MRWLTRWRSRRICWHHDHTTGESWLNSILLHHGMSKLFRCSRCDRAWII